MAQEKMTVRMRHFTTVLFGLTAYACVPSPPREPTRSSELQGPSEPINNDDESETGAPAQPMEQVYWYPLVRKQTVNEQTSVKTLSVSAEPYGATGWTLTVRNDGAAMVTAIWDESSFVSADGTTLGRLIPGETRRMDAANAHPPTPIAPHSTLKEPVLVEKLLDAEETESKVDDQPAATREDAVHKFRQKLVDVVAGGHLYLTVANGGAKQTWVGVVQDSGTDLGGPKKGPPTEGAIKPSFYCMGIGDSGIGGNCTRTSEACDELRARLSQIAGGIDQCRRVTSATCFAYKQEGEDRESCWIDQKHCRSLRRDVSRKRNATGITSCTDL